MKKIVSIILIIASLFTLSSTILCCGAPIVSQTSNFEALNNNITNDNNAISIKEEIIKKFFAEKGKYFPPNKTEDLYNILKGLDIDELKIVTNMKFDNPFLMLITSISAGPIGLDRFMAGDNGMGALKLSSYLTLLVSSRLGHALLAIGSGLASPFAALGTAGALCFVPIYLYDIFTVFGRTKQANYEYLLKMLSRNM